MLTLLASVLLTLGSQSAPAPSLKSPLQPVGKGSFQCAGAPVTLTTFYNTEPGLAVLKRGTDTRVAFRVPAASGAHYVGDDVSFWEARGEATINWSGAERLCKKTP